MSRASRQRASPPPDRRCGAPRGRSPTAGPRTPEKWPQLESGPQRPRRRAPRRRRPTPTRTRPSDGGAPANGTSTASRPTLRRDRGERLTTTTFAAPSTVGSPSGHDTPSPSRRRRPPARASRACPHGVRAAATSPRRRRTTSCLGRWRYRSARACRSAAHGGRARRGRDRTCPPPGRIRRPVGPGRATSDSPNTADSRPAATERGGR